MGGFLRTINGISRFLNAIAGISLTFLMLLTIADVILRGFKRPVVGTYELVAFSGAVVIGFSMPLTSWVRAHIFVDFFILKFSQRGRDIFNIEVSLTLQMPFYPVAYGVGVCCFIQCLVMVCDIVKISGGKYDE
jgi:TRAP-type C4-dicarboxylate transport system permease small subunit